MNADKAVGAARNVGCGGEEKPLTPEVKSLWYRRSGKARTFTMKLYSHLQEASRCLLEDVNFLKAL